MRYSRAMLAMLIAVLFTACSGQRSPLEPSPPAPASSTPTASSIVARWKAGQPIRVVVLGNSISEGFYADGWEGLQQTPDGHLSAQESDTGSGVVVQLRRFLRARNAASVVRNASASGYTAHRTSQWLDANPLTGYDLAFLPLTVNDANQGIQPAEFAGRLQGVIDRLVSAGIVPVLVKENDIYGIPESRFGIPYTAYMAAVDQLAAQNRLSVVDSYTPFRAAVAAGGGIEASGLFSPLDTFVGLHPSQAGHDILFRAYADWFMRQ